MRAIIVQAPRWQRFWPVGRQTGNYSQRLATLPPNAGYSLGVVGFSEVELIYSRSKNISISREHAHDGPVGLQ